MKYSELKGIFEEFGYDESVDREYNGLVENLSHSELKELKDAVKDIGDYSELDEDFDEEDLYDYLLNYVKSVGDESVCLSFWESNRRGLVSSVVDIFISFDSGDHFEYDGYMDVLITDLSVDELRDYLRYLDELIQKYKEIGTDEYGDYYEYDEYLTKLGLDTDYKHIKWVNN